MVGVLRVNRRAAPGRDTGQGADPAETARRVEMALRTFGARPGDPPTWVAAVVRRARDGERRRVLAWYSAQLGAVAPGHHAGDMDSVVISLLAGGAGRGEVRQRLAQVAAALPGFDVGVRVRILSPWPSAAAAGAVAARRRRGCCGLGGPGRPRRGPARRPAADARGGGTARSGGGVPHGAGAASAGGAGQSAARRVPGPPPGSRPATAASPRRERSRPGRSGTR